MTTIYPNVKRILPDWSCLPNNRQHTFKDVIILYFRFGMPQRDM